MFNIHWINTYINAVCKSVTNLNLKPLLYIPSLYDVSTREPHPDITFYNTKIRILVWSPALVYCSIWTFTLTHTLLVYIVDFLFLWIAIGIEAVRQMPLILLFWNPWIDSGIYPCMAIEIGRMSLRCSFLNPWVDFQYYYCKWCLFSYIYAMCVFKYYYIHYSLSSQW